MAFNSRNASMRHLLILLYVFAVVLLTALLAREVSGDKPLISLSHVSGEDQQGPSLLSLHGNAFYPGIKGVLAKTLVNEKALLWHHLKGIPVKAIDIKDDLALVSCYGKKVVSLDLSDGNSPKLLGSLELPGKVNQIKILGELALVALSAHSGLALIDLKDPSALKLVRHYPLQGFVSNMVVGRDMIYYTNLHQGVSRIDLSVEHPMPEPLAAIDSALHLDLLGNRLAVGTTRGRVHLFDITQTGLLVEVGGLDSLQSVRGVVFSEEALVVAYDDASLRAFNLSSWPKLSRPVSLDLPGRPLSLERAPGRASIAAILVGGGVSLFDVSLPANPVLTGHLKTPSTYKELKLQPEKIIVTSQEGLQAFSINEIQEGASSMLAPAAVIDHDYFELKTWNGHVYGYKNNRLVDFGGEAPTGVRSSNRVTVFTDNEGISLFEQREDGQFDSAGSLAFAENPSAADVRDDYLYMAHHGGLRIFSGALSGELVWVSDLPLPGRLIQLKILGSGFLLAATRDEGVLVVDVSDPLRPLQVASFDMPSPLQTGVSPQDLLVDGHVVYLSHGPEGVHAFDVSSPAQPQLLQMIDTPGSAKAMALSDGLLLVADGREGLFLIDVRASGGAVPLGSLPTPLTINQIAVVGDGLIVSSRAGGTMKLPLPRRLETLEVVSEGEARAVVETVEKGQYVYLYDERASLKMAVSVP